MILVIIIKYIQVTLDCSSMDKRELKEILAFGKSSTVEFKRKATTPEKLAKEISALANTKGGMLFIGVDDNGSIYGI